MLKPRADLTIHCGTVEGVDNMSFGSSQKPPPIPPPPPTTVAPEVSAAKESLREKLKRMQGRESTQLVSPGFLVPSPDRRRGLSATLG